MALNACPSRPHSAAWGKCWSKVPSLPTVCSHSGVRGRSRVSGLPVAEATGSPAARLIDDGPGLDGQSWSRRAPLWASPPLSTRVGNQPGRYLSRIESDPAHGGLSSSSREEHELIPVGMDGWSSPELMHQIRGGIPGVRWLNHVPKDDPLAITGGATVCIYVSLC